MVVLVCPGPSTLEYKWTGAEDYIMVVNFAGLVCPRYDSVVALDTHRGPAFKCYPPETVFYCAHARSLGRLFKNVNVVKNYHPKAGCSSLAFGLCVLKQLGFSDIVVIGADSRFTKVHNHADYLIKKGLYPQRFHSENKVLRDATDKTIEGLGLNVTFLPPSSVGCQSEKSADPCKP